MGTLDPKTLEIQIFLDPGFQIKLLLANTGQSGSHLEIKRDNTNEF